MGRFDTYDDCFDHGLTVESCDDSGESGETAGSDTGGDGSVHCTDPSTGVCTELLSLESASAYESQCKTDGELGTGPCPRRDGPACLNASATAAGTPIEINVFWGPDFCSMFPHIDTAGTCMDLGGTPQGSHCPPP
jgi:hypothetical protein